MTEIEYRNGTRIGDTVVVRLPDNYDQKEPVEFYFDESLGHIIPKTPTENKLHICLSSEVESKEDCGEYYMPLPDGKYLTNERKAP